MIDQTEPEPVPSHVKCSVCEQPWPAHEALAGCNGITLMTCVQVLKAELSMRPSQRSYGNPSPFDGLLAAGGASG